MQDTKMTPNTKVLIPNKEWIIKAGNQKVGSISRVKKGYVFLKNGYHISLKTFEEIVQKIGVTALDNSFQKVKEEFLEGKTPTIYDFPCNSAPFNPVYNIQKKLPLFSKSNKSKCQYCAGYYVIKFRKGWVKSFCPKLITLERYKYCGPFKTENEMKLMLNNLNKT